MSHFLTIVKKEVRELLTIKTLIPIIALTLVFGLIGQSVGNISEKAEEKPKVGIINEDDSKISSNIVDLFENLSEVVYSSSKDTEATEALRNVEENGGVALITIPPGFGENIRNNTTGNIKVQWLLEGLGIMESIPTEAVNGLIQVATQRLSKTIIGETGKLDPDMALQPVRKTETTYMRGKVFKGLTPGAISQALSSHSTLVPIIIMIIILMSGSQVIESMGMEKGNKTLETLLTLPVKRSHIAIGKIMGSAIVGLLFAAIYMIGFGYYMSSSFQAGSANIAQAGLTLGILDYSILAISLALTIIAGLTICMLMGTFAKDYKSAQMLMFPLMILVFIPFFLTMFKSFYTFPLVLKGLLFAIPFSHPMMAMNFLLFDDFMLVAGGVIYVGIFTAGIMALVSYIFKSDTLITGRFESKWLDKIRRK